MNAKLTALAVIAVLIVVVGWNCIYVVDETKQVVVTRFGKPVWQPKTTAGMGFKLPWEKANFFPKNLLEWDGEPGELPTHDKTLIWVDTFARWKIVDPLLFYQTAEKEEIARNRLSEIIDPAVRDAIASYPLIETVRQSNRVLDAMGSVDDGDDQGKSRVGKIKVGRNKITDHIKERAGEQLKGFGIELLDVKIKRLNYAFKVRQAVYRRMIAERKQISEKYRSEGQGAAKRIQGDMEKKLKEITSLAYKKAQEIKGQADGKATEIYAKAYSMDPEFYSFVKTLDVYRESLGKESTMVLSTESEFFKYFKNAGTILP